MEECPNSRQPRNSLLLKPGNITDGANQEVRESPLEVHVELLDVRPRFRSSAFPVTISDRLKQATVAGVYRLAPRR